VGAGLPAKQAPQWMAPAVLAFAGKPAPTTIAVGLYASLGSIPAGQDVPARWSHPMQRAGQVECKQVVMWDANAWSSQVQFPTLRNKPMLQAPDKLDDRVRFLPGCDHGARSFATKRCNGARHPLQSCIKIAAE